MSRYVVVPKPIVAVNPLTKKPIAVVDDRGGFVKEDDPWSLYRFMVTWILTDQQRFGTGTAALRQVLKLYDKFESTKDGDVVELDDDVWKKLCDVIEEAKYPPSIAHQLLPLIDAVLDAKKEKPSDPARPN